VGKKTMTIKTACNTTGSVCVGFERWNAASRAVCRVGEFYSFGSKKNIYFLPLLFFIRWGGTVQYRFVNLPSD